MSYNPNIGDLWPFASSRGLTGRRLDAPRWFALITAPQREKKASDRLKNARVTVRYPTVEKVRHIHGQKRVSVHPMISQIIYAQFDYEPHWDVLRQRGVIAGVFSRDGEPIVLDENDVARVMKLPAHALRIEEERAEAVKPKVGEPAMLIGGPFSDFFVDVTRVEGARGWYEVITDLGRIKGEDASGLVQRISSDS
mgnify:CR=1 FL=1